jgi:uncharacterized protein YdhG (YjbR/CyaY superfamily)
MIGTMNQIKTKPTAPRNIDEYISAFPQEVQEKLQKVRMTIRELVPEAQETIKYGMPVFTLNGNLIYFAGFKKHISIFPAPEGDEQFNAELAPYKAEKSTLHFSLDKPVPYDLISMIVKYRLQDHLAGLAAKRKSD